MVVYKWRIINNRVELISFKGQQVIALGEHDQIKTSHRKLISMAPNTSNTLTCLIVMFIFLIAVVSDDCPVKCSCSSRNNGKSVLCSSKGIKSIQINRLPKETVEM